MSSSSLSKTYGLFAPPEIAALKKAVCSLPDKPIVVVLGSGPGTATMAILEARPDVKVYSVDIIDARTERQHAERSGFRNRLVQIRERSANAGMSWDGSQVDLLFVDAWHSYDSVKEDNGAWLSYLKDDGIAWYHDYGTSNSMYMEVKRAVDEDMEGQEQIARACSSVAFRWKSELVEEVRI